MEGDGHDSVCEVEGLLHAITMVDVDVDVQDSRVVPLEGRGGGTEAGK